MDKHGLWLWVEEFPGAGAPVRRKPCLEHMLPLGVGEAEPPAGCRAGGLSAEVMRAAGRASQSGGCFLNLVYANLKLTRVIYA